jgi:hypothetical protein
MPETLYTALDGPKGRAEIYEVSEIVVGGPLPDSLHGQRPVDVHYVVRFGSERQTFLAEGEAVEAAKELSGAED